MVFMVFFAILRVKRYLLALFYPISYDFVYRFHQNDSRKINHRFLYNLALFFSNANEYIRLAGNVETVLSILA